MDMSTPDEDHAGNSRPTTASIDRRVERLEIGQAETTRKVDALGVQMDYLKELTTMRFASMDTTLAAHGTKLDLFITKIDALILRGQEQAGDLSSTPMGRSLEKRISSLEISRDANDDAMQAVRGFGSGFRQYVIPSIAVVLSVLAFASQMGWFKP